MISQKMYELGSKKSTIRTIFEYGKMREKEVGKENVYDFSLGNPNVPTPQAVTDALVEILTTEKPEDIHGYTVAQGDESVRTALSESINRRFGTDYSAKNLFMTAGAAASLTICFKALCEENDEFITFAPYFPEYKCFVESVGAKFNVVPAQVEDFQINFEEFEKILNKNTKGVIINSPNNPSGAVYSEETIKKLAEILSAKQKEYGHPIFIIADEPYREVVYDNVNIPYVPNYYDNTLVCYSYSKSLSLPGERIGYIVIPDKVEDFNSILAAVAGAARVLTHVNAPALFQKAVAKCADVPTDVSAYKKNRDLLYNGLIDAGFECVKPGGAFYLFPKALEEDEVAFCEKAKKYDLLLVPGGDFGCPGHFRASYCISTDVIERSLPLFKKFAQEEYGK